MSPSRDPEQLEDLLGGYFVAVARGLAGSDLVLSSREGEEFGLLRVDGEEGARLEAGEVRATIERGAGPRYRMLADGAEVLAETAGPADAPEVWCAGSVYGVRLGLLRNAAAARSRAGSEAARVVGGLTNRRYEVFFDAEDEGALLLAVFLLYRIVALRRRAFLTGGRAP